MVGGVNRAVKQSSADVAVHEFSVKVGSHVIVDETFLFLYLSGLVAEYGVLVPTFRQRVSRIYQGVSLQQLGLSIGHRLPVLLLSLKYME